MFKNVSAFFLILGLIVSAGAFAARAQAGGDKVLVAGAKPLRQSDVDALVEFYEWAFGASFSASERGRFRELTASDHRANPAASRRGIDDLLASFNEVKALGEDEREARRRKFAPVFIESLRQSSADPVAQMLVAIYERVQSGDANVASSPDEVVEEPAAGSGGDLSDFVGKWVWGRSGSSTYTTGGAYVGGNGSRFTYQFSAGGAVEYTGIMNVMTAGCRLQAFTIKKGRATLSGDRLTINWQPASFSRDDSCSPSKNYKKTLPAETETFRVSLKESNGQKQLCLTGKDETCFSPEN